MRYHFMPTACNVSKYEYIIAMDPEHIKYVFHVYEYRTKMVGHINSVNPFSSLLYIIHIYDTLIDACRSFESKIIIIEKFLMVLGNFLNLLLYFNFFIPIPSSMACI